jgi:site-specific recombinase XerD
MNEKRFNNLLWEFHRDLKLLNNFSEETVKTYISCIQKYNCFSKEKLNIDLLQTKEEHLFEYILDLTKNLSASRITHFRAALRRFFKMLHLFGEIQRNPAKNMLPIKRTRSTRHNYIPPDIILSMIDAIDCTNERETNLRKERINRDKVMILLLWCLGLRSGEMRAIKKEDIKIINAEKKIALLTVHGKGAKERALLIMDKLFDLVIEYIKELEDTCLVFPGKDNKIMDDSTVGRRIKKYLKVAGINLHITAHCLRHSFATEMYYADVPLDAIRTMLGHENLRETSVYIHVSREDMQTALSLLSIKGKSYAA